MPGNSSRELKQAPEKKRRRTNRGGSAQGLEGTDFLLGEEAVLRNFAKQAENYKQDGTMNCEAGDSRGVGAVSDVPGDHGGGDQVSAATCAQGDAKDGDAGNGINETVGGRGREGGVRVVIAVEEYDWELRPKAKATVSEAVDVVPCNVVVVLLASVVKVVDKAVCNVVIVMVADMVEAAVMLRSARSLFKCQTKAPLITM
ncbi:hypothetical protein PF004_g11480 [Phytophthora fragariae]|uniref:Uncharacterized protein n=1 Tax=Phytophthora fragariae TaxID=53985 RepID=A0A6G0NXU6_9STRA|nr:hypothetical protein PF004_g11480 [Phytophthora fragariae]